MRASVCVLSCLLATTVARGAPPTSTIRITALPATAAPTENAQGRRAIRGAPVDGVHESEELRQLRQFEEQSFPPGAPMTDWSGTPPDESTAMTASRPRSLTGGLGPDALPPSLRSPELEPRRPSTASAIPWLNQLKLPDLPIRLDPRVIRYLEFYKDDPRGRTIMSSWLRKQGRWQALFDEALRRAHLPLALTYISMIESSYDPLDKSHAGAVGLWQFMPEGGRIYGLRIDYWVDQRRDPEKATAAFMRYIGDLKERFGAWPLTLAAFNAGYGAVLRAMQKYNTNDYWELCRHEDGLPWETTLYVPKTMAVAIVGENRKLFGYDELSSESAYAFDRVRVPASLSVAAIAKAAGTSTAEIVALNPELRRNRTPPDGAWEARVPRHTGARFTAAYEQLKEMVKPFVVRFGERLEDIAAAHGITTRELRALNGVDDSAEVHAGLTLVVPDGKPPLPPPPSETVIVAVPDKELAVPGKRRIFYRTLPQDTPADIAAFFKVKPNELAKWNNVDLDARLASNMVLQLFVSPDFDTSKAALVDGARVRVVTVGSAEFFDLVEARRGRKRLTYAVKKGDDIKRIAKRFNLTVADLERINRFGAQHTDLTVGQKLTVYVPMSAAERAKAAQLITPGGVTAEPPVSRERGAAAQEEPRDPIVDDDARAAEGVVVPPSASSPPPSLPRPPPPDGRP
jgi:membrane-bound lytic murein transglycosylase D